MTVTYAHASEILRAGVAHAQEIGVPSCLAVVDGHGHLLAFAAMDGALLACRDLAIGKATSAAYLQMPTADLAALSEPGGSFPGLAAGVPAGRYVPFAGGWPLDDAVSGAIGVSGGTLDQDTAIAQAALSVLR